MAVGGVARWRRALRDARDDVFKDRICGVGNRGGGIVVDAIPIPFFNAETRNRRASGARDL